jgi:plastocyanin
MKSFLNSLIVLALLAAPALAYEVMEVENGGTISGTVTYTGKDVKPKKVAVSKDQETCGHEPREMPRVTTGPEAGLAKAVVTLEGIEKGKGFPEEHTQVIDQQHCEFLPFLQIVQTGQPLKVKNSDPVLHNIQATQDAATLFNQAQPFQGLEFENTIEKPGPVSIQCNAHSWMEAYLYASDHPYAVITGEDGKFSLEGVPAGEYTLVVWHPFLGEQASPVKVEAGQTAQAGFTYDKRLRSRQNN